MRRMLVLLFVFWSSLSAAPAGAQMSEAQVAQALVGSWGWQSTMNGAVVNNQLTLAAGGDFTYTTSMQSYRIAQSGRWQFRGGWLMFKTTWSSALDPAGKVLQLGPIQIIEVGRDFVRTPAGIAHRLL